MTARELFTAPTSCPSCSTDLVREGEYLRCPAGMKCPAQRAGCVKRWVQKLGVKDVGDTLIDCLVASGVREPADLYHLDPVVLADFQLNGKRLGVSSAKRVVSNLHAKKELRLSDFIGSLGIDLCGRSICEMLVEAGFDTLGKMLRASEADIASVPRMGATKAQAFVSGLHERTTMIDNLLDAGVTIKKPVEDGKLSGKTVCFTGFRNPDLEERVRSVGGSVKSSVGKTLSYLVAKDPKSKTGKVKKARDLGIEVIGVPDLEALL